MYLSFVVVYLIYEFLPLLDMISRPFSSSSRDELMGLSWIELLSFILPLFWF